MNTKSFVLAVFFALVFSAAYCQKESASVWRSVDSLVGKQYYNEAYKQSEKLFNAAIKNRDSRQCLIAATYMSRTGAFFMEDNVDSSLVRFRRIMPLLDRVDRSICCMFLAKGYSDYFRSHEWIIYANDEYGEKDLDYALWPPKRFKDTVSALIYRAFADPGILQKTSAYELGSLTVVDEGKDGDLTPTLYDVAVWVMAEIVDDMEYKGLRKNDLDHPELVCAEAERFVNMKVVGNDSSRAMVQFCIRQMQQQENIHLQRGSSDAVMIEMYCRRLLEIGSFLEFDIDDYEVQELPKVIAHYRKGNSEHITRLYYHLAERYNQESNHVAAVRAIDTAVKLYPKSPGAIKCLQLRQSITQKDVDVKMQDVSPSEKHLLALASVRNVDHLYFRIVKSVDFSNRDSEKERRAVLLNQKVLKSWDMSLPKRTDYKTQNSYFVIPPMPQGQYFILASSDSTFASEGIAIAEYEIEDVVFLAADNQGSMQRGFVVDRVSGKPVAGLKVTLSAKKSYNGTFHTLTTTTTDKDGYYDFMDYVKSNYRRVDELFYAQVSVNYRGKEIVSSHDRWNRDRHIKKKNSDYRFFLDRPIYKPGDTVHFAYLAFIAGMYDGNVEKGNNVTFILRDINGKGVDTLHLVTDEYGLCTGSFAIASDATPGTWKIGTSGKYGNMTYFDVEAYKQPKYTVTLSKPDEERRFGQTVRIEGAAASYTSVPVAGAKVEYHIERTETAQYWRKNWESFFVGNSSIIAEGSLTTDENGLFTISFVPQPDSSCNLEDKPCFDYYIYVKVTDINGETHENATSLTIGYENSFVMISETAKNADDVSLTVIRRSLDGNALDGLLNFEVVQLRQPDRPQLKPAVCIIAPDSVYMPIGRAEFERLFPIYDYDGSANDNLRWPVLKSVYSTRVRLTPDKPYVYDFKGLKAGTYKVMASIVTGDGDTLTTDHIVTYSPSSAKLPVTSQLITASVDKKSYEVGETVRLRVGSPYDDVTLYVVVSKANVVSRHEVHHVSRGFTGIAIPVADSLVGDFRIELAALKENIYENDDFYITVERADKKLDVGFETFRDKLEPQSKETWTLRIKDSKTSQPVKAALIMTMYDNALESYRSMHWTLNPWSSPYTPYMLFGHFVTDNSHYYFQPDLPRRSYTDYTFRTVSLADVFPSYYNGRKYKSFSATARGEMLEEEVMYEVADAVEVTNEFEPREAISQSVIDIGAPESGARLSAEDIAHFPSPAEEIVADEDFKFPSEEISLRSNLSTLAFFKPLLRSDDSGTVELSFVAPELLTKWSICGRAWTKDLKTGSLSASAVTQKRLMVVPNMPRFLRHGDTCLISVKVSNLSGKEQDIVVSFEMTPDVSNKRFGATMTVGDAEKQIRLKDGASGEVSFLVAVPRKAIFVATYKVVARCEGYSDGEQAPVPLLPSRQLVTESMAFYINGAGEKRYEMEHLSNLAASGGESTLVHHGLTVDMTPNPLWLALQSLPYVVRQQNPSNIYLANAIYANSLSFDIVKNNPAIEKLFNEWLKTDPGAFMSELDRNISLKQTVMEETPWLADAVREEQRHRDVANFFNRATLQRQIDRDLSKLLAAQRSDGGWSWIDGGRYSSLYTTQYILKTFGLLIQQGVSVDNRTRNALNKALEYVDSETYKYYKKYLKNTNFESVNLDYLYMRSYYAGQKTDKRYREAYDFFYTNAKKHNEEYRSLFDQSLLALVFNRGRDTKLAAEMVRRIREKALYSDEMGMYWRDNKGGYRWNERPIETQALLIRTFSEVLGDSESVARMQQWLLKQKQTTNWNTDVATINAIQALIVRNSDVRQSNNTALQPSKMTLVYGNHSLHTDTSRIELHVSDRLDGGEISPADGRLTIRKEDDGIAWGAMYWQYFENVEKIASSGMGVSLKRTLYRVESDKRLTPVAPTDLLKVGDKVRVRLEISSDRTLEYLELKDPRCAAFEPVSTASGWRWDGAVSYYCSVTNAAQTLYIDRLEKGRYIVEYDLYVNNAGTYVTAPTTIQCLYAPEFRALCPAGKVSVAE